MARLLIHGTSHGKKTLRQLPESKILIVWEGGGNGHILSFILIVDFQGLKDVFGGSAFGGKVLDAGINGSDGSNGGSGGSGGSGCLGVPDLLGVIVSFGFPWWVSGSTFIGAMFLFAASETESFSDALSSIHWREVFKQMVSTSMALGSLVECELGEKEERGRPCPFLRAMM